MKIWMQLILIWMLPAQIIQRYHPELEWKSIDTEHFTIVYHQGTERSAKRVAQIAEHIYEPVTSAYAYKPSKKVTFIIKDTDDYSNGAAYFLDGKVEIYTEHLDYMLRGTHDWLKDVVTHEFIHIIHIQKSLSTPRWLPFGIFQVMQYEDERRKDVIRGFPNAIANLPVLLFNVPAWLAEGVAQHQVPGRRYDYRDTQREMILRDRFVFDNVLELSEMSGFGKTSIGNESVYNQGYAFVNHLIEKYGNQTLINWSTRNSELGALLNYYETVFEETHGLPIDSLFSDWKQEMIRRYDRDLRQIGEIQDGMVQDTVGTAQFHAVVSDDGSVTAYLSNDENRGLWQNVLVLKKGTSTTRISDVRLVESTLRFIPNTRILIYSKKSEPDRLGSNFSDIYTYNTDSGEEIRISEGLRLRHPAVNADGTVVCVTSHDGTANLVTFKLTSSESWSDVTLQGRNGRLRGSHLKQITHFTDFTQFFHPIWDGDQIITDYATGYRRNITRIDPTKPVLKPLFPLTADYRHPFIDVDGDLWFSSDRSGVYNIYTQEDRRIIPRTNVIGGAFMPSVHEDELLFSNYRELAFRIHQIDIGDTIEVKHISTPTVETEISDVPVPQLNLKDGQRLPYRFSSTYVIPRVFWDDTDVRVGAALLFNELIDRASLLFSATFNPDGERDLYGGIEIRNLEIFNRDPVFFFDVYNQKLNASDQIRTPFDANDQQLIADRDVSFILMQYELGFKLKLSRWLDAKSWFTFADYKAELEPTISKPVYDNGSSTAYDFPFLRYTYHIGREAHMALMSQVKDRSLSGDIVPRTGWTTYLDLAWNNHRFLDDFAFGTSGLSEVYKTYDYMSLYWNGRIHFPGLWESMGISVRAKTAANLAEVDEFYDHYAGGWIGLKGYPFFAIHGRTMALAELRVNQLIAEDIAWGAGLVSLRNLALMPYVQSGSAWNDSPDWVSNVGLQLKFDTYGPMKLVIDAAWPLNTVKRESTTPGGQQQTVIYSPEWRWYLSLMYDFELDDFL